MTKFLAVYGRGFSLSHFTELFQENSCLINQRKNQLSEVVPTDRAVKSTYESKHQVLEIKKHIGL